MSDDNSATAVLGIAPSLGAAPRLAARTQWLTSSAIRDLLALTQRPEVISLAGGLPDPGALPAAWLRGLLDEVLATDGPAALQYSTTEGDPALRAVLAGWESAWCDRPVDPDELLMCSGSQQALDLLAKALIDEGDTVVVDDPAYLGALQAFAVFGAHVVGIEQDAEGMRVDVLADRLAAGLRPTMLYTTPTFSNPAGCVMPLERRRALAELGARYGFWIVEDDPYHQLSFTGEPPLAVAAFDANVIRLGSLSKVLAPGLRLGWVIAPPEVRTMLARLKQATDLHTSTLTQRLARTALADSATLATHVQAVRTSYAERARTLTGALAATFGDRCEVNTPTGGMFCWATFRDGTDTSVLLARAVEHGTAFVPGAAFAVDRDRSHSARLSFVSAAPDQLIEAVRRLAAAAAARADRPTSPAGPPSGIRPRSS